MNRKKNKNNNEDDDEDDDDGKKLNIQTEKKLRGKKNFKNTFNVILISFAFSW